MKKRSTVLGDLINLSVHLNGLLIPITSVESVVARYTQSLISVNDSDIYPVSLLGSCVGIKYRDRYLVLCTRHQLKNGNLEQIGLLIEKGKRTVTSGGVRRYRDGLFLTDVHDLAAFDFSEPCSELPALRNCFFEFKALPPDTLSDKVVGIIVSGYPFDDQNYDLENNRHLGQAKRIVLCKLDGPDQPRDQALLRLRTLERLNFSPDGISGGGAFVVQLEGLEARAYFAGIVTRAGRDHVHIVKSPFIQQFMDAWISRSGRAE